jgi:antigen flippase
MSWIKPLKSKFLSANVTLGIPTLVRLLAGLAKTKTSAVILGAAGVGIVGVGSQLQMLGVTCASLSVASGFIRELSSCIAANDHARKRDLLGTSLALQLILNGALLLAGILLLRPLALWTFGNEQDYRYLIPILMTVPMQSLMVSHLWGVFYARGELKLLARASTIAALVEAAAYIALVRAIGVAGAFWGVTLGMLAWMSILLFYALRFESAGDLFHLKLRRDFVRQLLGAGAVMTVTGGVTYLSNTLIRIHITRSLGASSAGIYQVVMALTAYYLPYFTNGVWGRLFPKVSATGLDEEGCAEWSEAIILTAILSAGVQIALMVFARPLVSAFYTHEFLSAIPLTPIQFLGDLFYLVSIPCLGVMLGLNRMRLYLVTWVIYYGSFYALATVLTAKLGLQGTIVAYLLSNLGLACFCLGFFVRSVRSSRLVPVTLSALALAAAAVTAQAALCLRDADTSLRMMIPAVWALIVAAVLFSPRAKRMLLILKAETEAS